MSVSSRAGSQNTNPPVHFSLTLQNCGCVHAFVRIWNSYFVMSLVLLTHFQSLGDVSSIQLAGMLELSFFSQFCFAGRQAFRLFVLFSLLDLDSQFSIFSNHRFWAGDWHSCSIPQAVTVVMLTALGPAPCARLSFVTIHQGRECFVHRDLFLKWLLRHHEGMRSYSDWSMSASWAYAEAICLVETLSLLIFWKCLQKVRADKVICLRLLLILHTLPVRPIRCASVSMMSFTDVQ